MRGIGTAFRTLTNIPIPGGKGEGFARSLPWFPVVGGIIGLVLYGLAYLWLSLPTRAWPQGGALLLILFEVWLTRGLHLDGLADWADSMGGGRDMAKRLNIMKDSHLGSFGVVALILAMITRLVAYDRVLQSGTIVWLICIFALSRGLLVPLITGLPYAREERGMGKPFVDGASSTNNFIACILCLAICMGFGPIGVGAFFIAFVVMRILKIRYRQSFGGITGDLLGTASEAIQLILVLILAFGGRSVIPLTGWGWLVGYW